MVQMSSIVGFSVYYGLDHRAQESKARALSRALRHFPWLQSHSIVIGASCLQIWGHGDIDKLILNMDDGQRFVIVGSPVRNIPVDCLSKALQTSAASADLRLPWDGRVILLKISADGRDWTMCNDWCGSIPVFHAQVGEGRIASTLESVIVAAAGYTPDDFFLPGLVSLLINGHYLGEWTLCNDMNVLPADCVAEWDDEDFRWKRLWTVKPSDERWDRSWDELTDEMYELSRQAIADVLKTQPSWILPLSGGLDSRLIAAVDAEMGVELFTYTYGPSAWDETIYARQVSKTLKLPWKRVDLGTDYLARYTPMWADWFGSALHFHGMYQMPFLRSLNSAPPNPIVQGFLGEALAGLHLPGLISAHRSKGGRHRPLTDSWIHWSVEEVKSLLKVRIDDALEQIAEEMERQIKETPGAWFQQLMFLDIWNRQRLFISYQPIMYDYWRGVATPFHNREYARFCLSLPLLALERRRLQGEMFRRHYRKLAEIPGTYGALPLALSRQYIFRRGVAELLPRPLRRGPLREFNPLPSTLDQDCVRATGRAALWPIYEAWDALAEWLDLRQVLAAHSEAARGDLKAMRKLQGVQALAYRLLGDQSITGRAGPSYVENPRPSHAIRLAKRGGGC